MMKNSNKAMIILIVLAIAIGSVLAQQDNNKNAPKSDQPKVIVVNKNRDQDQKNRDQDQEQKSKDDKEQKRDKEDKKPSEEK